ncbi:MAG: hypothetical protein IKN18_05580, partial [Neisseriaceae bacterium]|nr:hypothetical protein [Neisseriaceae bacterium]
MNKIYRTVYNETTNTWVAVEETAKSHRKSSGGVVDSTPTSACERVSGSLKLRGLTAAVAIALFSPLAVSPAFAASPNGTMHPNTQIGSSDGDENVNTVSGTGTNTVWGTHNTVSNNSTAFGQSNTATGDKSTAFGQSNKAFGNQNTAFGVNNKTTGANSTAFGENNLAGYIGTDVASLEQMGITTVADFCKAIGAPTAVWCTRKPTLEAARQASIGTQFDDEAGLATKLGAGGVSGAENATAWGLNNLAGNKQATAFGENSIANGVNSTAFGKDSYAYADNSLAALGGQVGLDSQGANNTAHSDTGLNSVAIGHGSWAKKDDAIALGTNSLANDKNAIAIGSGNLQDVNGQISGAFSQGDGSIAIGRKAEAIGAKNIKTTANEDGSIYLAKSYGTVNLNTERPATYQYDYIGGGSQRIAIGDDTAAYGDNAIALGGNTVSVGVSAIA